MINSANCDSVKFGLYARDIEKRFCKVYGNVISNCFEFNKNLISDAKEMLNSKKERKKFKSDLSSYQLAFLLSFGVQDTCVSARKFYESIMNDPEIIKKLSKSKTIKLLCLESESLPTVIGVCQVINEIIKEFGSGSKFNFTQIRILVIDNRGKWRRLCGYIIDTANSYFTNIELKLDFVEDFVIWSFQEFNDRIQELDFLVIARFFAEDRIFNYNLIGIVLNEIKGGAILFYLDSCNERFYAYLTEISKRHSFSQIKSCQNLHASFKDLDDEQYYLDLPVSWDNDFQPVMFSTWIKDIAVQNDSLPVVVKPVVSDKLNPKKSNKSATLNLNTDVSNSKKSKTSASEEQKIVIGKKKAKSSTKQKNKSDALSAQTNIVISKKKFGHLTPQCKDYDTPSEQLNLVIEKEKVKSNKIQLTQSNSPRGHPNVISGTKKEKTSTKHCNQSDSPNKQTNVVSGKKKAKSQKTHEVLDTLIAILNKQTIDSTTAKTPQESLCSNVPSDAAISRNVITKPENQVNSVKELGCENSVSYTTDIIKSKKKAKAATSKISASSKIVTTNQSDETLTRKQTVNGNVPPPVLTASQKKKGKSSEIKSKSNTNAESVASKELKKESVDKQAPTTTTPETEKAFPFNLPKKSSKANSAKTKKLNSNTTQKIKLNGKFSRMDLEKKNKDERHKMRAKKASFAKHANFDYDD